MRLFIAIDLPKDIKECLSKIQESLKNKMGEEDRISFVKTDNMHLTLKFLGEVREDKVDVIKEKLRSVRYSKFRLSINEIGAFPDKKPARVIWVGVKEEEQLFELHKLIDFSVSKYFPMEKEFKGHMTLGRVKMLKEWKEFSNHIKMQKIGEHAFDVDRFQLVQSKLLPTGPEYTLIEEYNLVEHR